MNGIATAFMRTVKFVYLTSSHPVTRVWLLRKSVPAAVRQRSRLVVLDELEAERLDRIRNPSKYLGK